MENLEVSRPITILTREVLEVQEAKLVSTTITLSEEVLDLVGQSCSVIFERELVPLLIGATSCIDIHQGQSL